MNDPAPFLFHFENRQRGGEKVTTILAALLCAGTLYAGGWMVVAAVQALKVRFALAAGCAAVAAAVFLFAAGLLRYIAVQVKGGFTFLEKISIDSTVVHYVYRDIEGEKFWAEPLTSFSGVQVLGFRGSSSTLLKTLPKSTGTAEDAGGTVGGFRWVVMLVHPVVKKTIRLQSNHSSDGSISTDLARTAQDFAERLRVPMLPPHLPVAAEPVA